MKKYILSIVFSVLPLFLFAEEPVQHILSKITNPNSREVTVVAHRGDWRFAPENSLAAIEHSIRSGVDVVELDVQKTKDGKLILMHDETLDRTTTGSGKISEWSLDSIQTLYLKNGANIKTIHRVPTLEEALLVAKGRIMVNLDKAYPIFDEIYPILEKTGTINQIIMKGTMSSADVKKDLGKYLDKILYMPIIQLDAPGAMQEVDNFMKELHPVAFEFLFVSDTCRVPFQIKEKLKGKSLIWYNTLWDTMAGGHDDDMSLEDPDKGYGYLIDNLGARIIQTDRQAYLIEYLRKRGLHN